MGSTSIPLPALPVRKEAMRGDEMKTVFGPRHGDIEEAPLLLELRRRSGAEVGRNAAVHDVEDVDGFPLDDACLTPVRPLAPEEIRALREREGASQAVFARYLNVTTGLISQWERGEKHPQGSSLKLLSLVARYGLGTVA